MLYKCNWNVYISEKKNWGKKCCGHDVMQWLLEVIPIVWCKHKNDNDNTYCRPGGGPFKGLYPSSKFGKINFDCHFCHVFEKKKKQYIWEFVSVHINLSHEHMLGHFPFPATCRATCHVPFVAMTPVATEKQIHVSYAWNVRAFRKATNKYLV